MADGMSTRCFRGKQQRCFGSKIFDEHLGNDSVVGLRRLAVKQVPAENQRQNASDNHSHLYDGRCDDRIPMPLVGQAAAILLQMVSLPTDLGTFRLNIAMERDDLFPGAAVSLDQFSAALGHFSLKLGHLLALGRLLPGVLLGHSHHPFILVTTDHPDH